MIIIWMLLALAIVCEVVATNLIPATYSFTRWRPTAMVVGMYVLTFYLLSQVVQELDVAVMYTLWSALGVLVVAAVGVFVRGERVNYAGGLGFSMIVVGVALINFGG